MMKTLYIVVPCYQEEEVLPETSKRLKKKLNSLIGENKISEDSRIMFVNDGSKDETWNIISNLHEKDRIFSGVNLSRNRGHQNALLAGITIAVKYADFIISLDADLQDDINAIDEMIDNYLNGYDVVYGVRSARKSDTAFKRITAESYYKIMKKLGVDLIYNHADYRLISSRVAEGLLSFKEVNLFLRGIIPQVGYKSTIVTYERAERFAGESKYPLKKMLAFAFDGITSFSAKPIRFITYGGVTAFIISIIMTTYFIVDRIMGHTVPGWASIIVSIWALGGLQLLGIGLIGEYIAKTYMEAKQRPKFLVETMLNQVKSNDE